MFGGTRIKELETEVAKLKSRLVQAENASEQDAKALRDIVEVAGLASSGIFSVRIKEQAGSANIQSVATAINSMLDSVEDGTAKITEGLVQYAGANYQHELQTAGYAGSIGSIMAGIVALGSNSSEIFALLTIIGETLRGETMTMTRESEELSNAANEQAANLEETAAAIEEITGNIQSNATKANDMARSADEARKATEEGAKMADLTATAMQEIATATQSINEAVTIIENIAFQTNILSLNAAVEAATAGEAGKGFAVVAQEVRNLANRSAEAAKSIKELTDAAKTKSGEGLQISQKMNDGFKTIAERIADTTMMVQAVASSSKEQMVGISQINDSIAQLDQMTQENARVAEQVSGMSQTILGLAETLMQTTSRTKFDSRKRDMVNDVDMIFDTTRLKLDHINFKENNYKKIKSSNAPYAMSDHHGCNLGKWLDAHKSDLSGCSAWSAMGEAHQHVHGRVKELCDTAVINGSNSAQTIKSLAVDVEKDTRAVFTALDDFKIHLGKTRQASQNYALTH